MPLINHVSDRLRATFEKGFSVIDIAEPLASFDNHTSDRQAAGFMDSNAFDLVGVRENGVVLGYALRASLGDGVLGDHIRLFDPREVVAEHAGLIEAIKALADMGHCFVEVFGQIGGIVTLGDLEKPPVRMWLFGFITMAEMQLAERLHQFFPNDSWQQHVSPPRLEKARELVEERKRRNMDSDLLSCLQLSDKAQIAIKNPELRELMGITSGKQGKKLFSKLESLRNNLAHAQPIAENGLDVMVNIAHRLEAIVSGNGATRSKSEPEFERPYQRLLQRASTWRKL